MNNPTCKYCGLLKSTVEETGSPCFEGHEFGEFGEDWQDEYPLNTFEGETKKELVDFIKKLLNSGKKMYEIGFEDGREEERKVWLKVSNELTK